MRGPGAPRPVCLSRSLLIADPNTQTDQSRRSRPPHAERAAYYVPMSNHLLVRTARGEAVERPPVWAMRQAGRWDPEFRAVRAGLGFYEF